MLHTFLYWHHCVKPRDSLCLACVLQGLLWHAARPLTLHCRRLANEGGGIYYKQILHWQEAFMPDDYRYPYFKSTELGRPCYSVARNDPTRYHLNWYTVVIWHNPHTWDASCLCSAVVGPKDVQHTQVYAALCNQVRYRLRTLHIIIYSMYHEFIFTH